MALDQEFDGREHTPSATTISTDVHGKLGKLISSDKMTSVVESKGVKTLGSTWEVAFGAPDGSLQKITLKIRYSGHEDFEDQLRSHFNLDDETMLEPLQLPLHFEVTSAPLDGDEDALPTVVKEFNGFYCGGEFGVDRGTNDPMVMELSIQMTSPLRTVK